MKKQINSSGTRRINHRSYFHYLYATA